MIVVDFELPTVAVVAVVDVAVVVEVAEIAAVGLDAETVDFGAAVEVAAVAVAVVVPAELCDPMELPVHLQSYSFLASMLKRPPTTGRHYHKEL